jgi:hypothetical protein
VRVQTGNIVYRINQAHDLQSIGEEEKGWKIEWTLFEVAQEVNLGFGDRW